MGEVRTINFSCDHADERTELYCPHSYPHSDPGVEPPVIAGYYCMKCGAMDMYEPWCFCSGGEEKPTTGAFDGPIIRDLTNERRLEVERDRLDQQAEALLSAEKTHRTELAKAAGGTSVNVTAQIAADRKLRAAADQVRKERGT